jgi:diacylglycerol kinase family enzyme
VKNHVSPAGRFAAWIAIAAAIVAAVALLLLVFRNALTLLVVFIALLVAGASGWIALTRHSLTRLLAVAVAVLALAVGATALVVRGALDELIVLGVAFGVFSISARIAIRQATLTRGSRPRLSTAGSRPSRSVLLMNPKSGGGKVGKFSLEDEARRRGVETILLGPGDDLQTLAREVAGSATTIGMAGGDGSQALVAQVAMEFGLPFVCIPAGTRNHFALDLGLDRDDVVGALDAYTDELERRIDLAFVNDRIFVNNVSLGIYAQIVASDAYRDAKLETMEKMLPDLLGPRAQPFDLRYRDADGVERQSAQLILVSNNPYRLDRLAGMGSRPKLDTGNLGIITVEIKNSVQAAELVSLEAVGQVRHFGGWREWSAPEFEVVSEDKVATGIDGESVMLDPPLRFRLAPAALRVRLPPAVAGLSPAAVKPGLTLAAVGELWKIATDRSE